MVESEIKESRKIRPLQWETDVEHGSTVFTFISFTKQGGLRKAAEFIIDLAERGRNDVS